MCFILLRLFHTLNSCGAFSVLCSLMLWSLRIRGQHNLWDILYIRADSVLVSSQWEKSLQSNTVSHWLGANLDSALVHHPYINGNHPLTWVPFFGEHCVNDTYTRLWCALSYCSFNRRFLMVRPAQLHITAQTVCKFPCKCHQIRLRNDVNIAQKHNTAAFGFYMSVWVSPKSGIN